MYRMGDYGEDEATKTTTTPPDRTGFDGQTREELCRDLGLDELTHEACLRELFEELYNEGPVPDEPSAAGGVRVTQMGPGRRHGSGKSE